MKFKQSYCILCLILSFAILQSCSTTKFVPKGQFLLDKVTVKSDVKQISALEMEPFVKQKSNFRTFTLVRLPLFIYNLSGKDSTRWYNKVLRNGGEPPVIFDSLMVTKTVVDFKRILLNKGYVHAKIIPEIVESKNKVKINYNIQAGEPFIISEYSVNIPDSVFADDLSFRINRRRTFRDTTTINIDSYLQRNSLVKGNSIFDLNMLDNERVRVTSALRRYGYFGFNKEFVGFVADTSGVENKIKLELTIYPIMQRTQDGAIVESIHKQNVIKSVSFYVDYNPIEDGDLSSYVPTDTVKRGDYIIYYGKRGRYIRPNVVFNSCYIRTGGLYNEDQTLSTYNSFSQLHILKNVNIKYDKVEENDSTKLHCVITCTPDKRQGISTEIEGTNSGGWFGVGVALGYSHRNFFGGSELLSAKLQGGYEAITPSFSTFKNNYFEVGGELALNFPRFLFPFINQGLRRRLRASTQFSSNYIYQRRPNYFTRTVLSTGVKYLWQSRRNSSIRHSFDLIDVSYIHTPTIDSAFYESLNRNARLYSFTNQFIMSIGYTYLNTNTNPNPLSFNKMKQPVHTTRASIETAGNTLAAITRIAGIPTDDGRSRKVFGTYFAQYIRGSIDYSRSIPVDEKNSIAWRIGGGIALPYGNSNVIPFQKRFFSGGANSVRGWAIRELGPGAFHSDSATFYHHSGDIRFDANLEFRSNIFWKLELAAFLDAGNIWTIQKYSDQEKGEFRINSFYKQIAAAWGLGLRLDLDFVLIRLDCGWKLYNPADIPRFKLDEVGEKVFDGYQSKWSVLRPFRFKENVAWHIAIGYPF